MARQRMFGGAIVLILFLVLSAGTGAAQGPAGGPGTEALLGTAFTYQGKLLDGGAPVDGPCDFQFGLYDALGGGTQLGVTLTVAGVDVQDGLFTVPLDFGSDRFNGEARWLQIRVRYTGGSAYTGLSPRVPLTPSPNALALPGLWTQQNVTSPNLIGGYWGNSVTAGVVGATIGGGGTSGSLHRVTDDYGTVAGGYNNQAGDNAGLTTDRAYAAVGGGGSNVASGKWSTVGGGYLNSANAESATVAGGYMNFAHALEATISGGHNNQVQAANGAICGGTSNLVSGQYGMVGGGYLNSASGAYSTIGGGDGNTASNGYVTIGGGDGNNAGSMWSTIGGGSGNQTSSLYSYQTIGGGSGNSTSDLAATVAGGSNNRASGGWSAVGGGSYSTASGDYATVGGGGGSSSTTGNTASGNYATVGGGGRNTAGGQYAMVPGGYYNSAAGDYSFAAGRQARATSQGCFVWADSTSLPLTCSVTDRWVTRSSGGVYLYTNSASSTGMYMFPSGSAWNAVSSRELKDNFAPVDTVEVLHRLVQAPITTWNYKAQDPSIRHIGLMADEFNALVDGLGGEGPDHINTLDADGVALAAIQGLHQVVEEQSARIAVLEEENADLAARVAALEGQGTPAAAGRPAWWLLVGALVLAAPGVGALGVVLARRRGGGR